VAVFCRNYLPVSQTFVRDHLRTLRRYRPVAVAHSLTPDGLAVDGIPVIVRRPNRTVTARIARRLSRRGSHPDIRTAIEQSQADLVHAHFGTGGVLVRDACRQLGLPLVVTFHGYDVTVRANDGKAEPLGKGYGDQRLALLRDADAIITVSQYLAGRLVQLGAEPSKVHVIPCGVDTTRFEATPVPHTRRVLFVGRLVEKKGCEDLLRAVAVGARSATVTIIGDGPLREALSRLTQELDIPADFLGAQPPERVRDEIRRAQLVALPSRTAANGDQEGLPVVALEAAASGRPVVGYRHSGIPEAVIDGHTGLLAVEGDVTGLAAILAELLDDPDRSQAMGTMARDRATQLFDLTATTARIEGVYERVLMSTSRRIAAAARDAPAQLAR
jgi:glycosyltransferase involved in cell wall biosynthesis